MFWVTVRITSNSIQNEAVQTITFNIRMCVCFYEKYEKLSFEYTKHLSLSGAM